MDPDLRNGLNVKKILKIISINAALVLLLLVLLDPFFKTHTENVFRSVNLREFAPNTDVYFVPSGQDLSLSELLEKKPYRIRTDEHGFIVGNSKSVHNTKSVDIIFFGGSTTECKFVDEDKRFPYLVGEKLMDTLSREKIQVVNGGVSGNTSLNSTINLLAKGMPLQPRIVIFMHNINDLSLLTKTGDYWVAPETRAIIQKQILESPDLQWRIKGFVKSIKDLFVPNLYARVKYIMDSKDLLHDSGQGVTDEWKGFREHEPISYDLIEKKFEQAVRSFIDLARSQGIEVVLMTQFNRFKPDDQFVRKVYNQNVFGLNQDGHIDYDRFCQYYHDLNQIAMSENLLLIDLENEVPANSTVIYDPVHLNNKGSELVAEMIAKKLQWRYPEFKIK